MYVVSNVCGVEFMWCPMYVVYNVRLPLAYAGVVIQVSPHGNVRMCACVSVQKTHSTISHGPFVGLGCEWQVHMQVRVRAMSEVPSIQAGDEPFSSWSSLAPRVCVGADWHVLYAGWNVL